MRLRLLAALAMPLLLSGCLTVTHKESRSVSSATTTTSTTRPTADPVKLKARMEKALISADVLGPLGFVAEGPAANADYPLLLCPEPLAGDTAMSSTRIATIWKNKHRGSGLKQFLVGYRTAEIAEEAIADAERSLQCGSFTKEDMAVRVSGKASVPPVGAEQQFAVCFRVKETFSQCYLLLRNADLVTSISVYAETDTEAAVVLHAAGKSIAPLMGP